MKDDDAVAVKSKLEALSLVGTVDVTREEVDNGYAWLVTFTSVLNGFGPLTANAFYYGFDDANNDALVGLDAPDHDAAVEIVGECDVTHMISHHGVVRPRQLQRRRHSHSTTTPLTCKHQLPLTLIHQLPLTSKNLLPLIQTLTATHT